MTTARPPHPADVDPRLVPRKAEAVDAPMEAPRRRWPVPRPLMDELQVRPVRSIAERDEVRRFQAEVYVEHGFLPELPPEGLVDDCYVERAIYMRMSDAEGVLIGTFRIIPSNGLGLPVQRFFDIERAWQYRLASFDADRVVEIASLATQPTSPRQARALFPLLVRAAAQYSLLHAPYRYFLCAVDPLLVHVMRRSLRIPLEIIGAPTEYYGIVRVPIIIDMINDLRYYAIHDPTMHDFYVSGLDLVIDDAGAPVEDLLPRSEAPTLPNP